MQTEHGKKESKAINFISLKRDNSKSLAEPVLEEVCV